MTVSLDYLSSGHCPALLDGDELSDMRVIDLCDLFHVCPCDHRDSNVITLYHRDHGIATFFRMGDYQDMKEFEVPGNRAAFSDLVFEKRTALGWSQEFLAERAGTSRTHINKIEKGRISIPREPLLGRLIETLEIEEEELQEVLEEMAGPRPTPRLGDRTPQFRLKPSDEAIEAGLGGRVMGLLAWLPKKQEDHLAETLDMMDEFFKDKGLHWDVLIENRSQEDEE